MAITKIPSIGDFFALNDMLFLSMIKTSKTAEYQLLQLIKILETKSKTLNINELSSVLNAIKSICANKLLINMLTQSLEALNDKKINNKISLTQREKQVLLLIADGLQSSHIADKLDLSKSTIETHRKNIRKKLKLTGNKNLFAFALVFSLQYRNDIDDDNF